MFESHQHFINRLSDVERLKIKYASAGELGALFNNSHEHELGLTFDEGVEFLTAVQRMLTT